MPRFWDLFSLVLNARKGWIGAGFVRCGCLFLAGKMRVGGLTRVFAEVFEGLAQKCFAGSGFEGRLSVVYGGEITVLSLRTPRWIRASGESILQGLKPFFDAAWEGQA